MEEKKESLTSRHRHFAMTEVRTCCVCTVLYAVDMGQKVRRIPFQNVVLLKMTQELVIRNQDGHSQGNLLVLRKLLSVAQDCWVRFLPTK
jgi:hypothetical protein